MGFAHTRHPGALRKPAATVERLEASRTKPRYNKRADTTGCRVALVALPRQGRRPLMRLVRAPALLSDQKEHIPCVQQRY